MIKSELELPCGVTLKNRIAKAAMSEQLGNLQNIPTLELETLYKNWAQSGASLLITGNVMVNKESLGEPRNVVFNGNEQYATQFKSWAKCVTDNGLHIWPQINHPGRQAMKAVSKSIVAPSVSKIGLVPGMFGKAKELTEEDINKIIEQFISTAKLVKDYGFTGLQIHGAHGYLISQFLSPITNQRTDKWGGSLECRAKFLLEIIKGTRTIVGNDFPISVKINSADFQKGGFSEEDCLKVLAMLEKASVDLIEISGGTYEAPAMVSGNLKESTKKREAFFIEFATLAKEKTKTPLMLTGGFRSIEGMNSALESGKVDLIGLGRPMVWDTKCPEKLMIGALNAIHMDPPKFPVKALVHMAELTWYVLQIRRLGSGLHVKHNSNSVKDFVKYVGMGQKDSIVKKVLNLF
jgi:2,4-dienoyl-CoA reductase-like NADH-dependent reductase (Old Yellow Enzyme family)